MNYKKLNMIAELKQKKELDKLYKQNTIDLNNYFAYSGKQERKNRFTKIFEEYNFNNASEIKFNPYNNLLILFPSELHHKILINKSDTIRYSLAFNLVPTGLLGNKNSDSQWIV